MESRATYEVNNNESVMNEYAGWHIDGKASADWALDKVREAVMAKSNAQAIADEILTRKQDEVNAWLAKECEKYDSTIAFFKGQLHKWAIEELESVNAKKKKPVQSISLPGGKVGFKKKPDKFILGGEQCSKNNKALLEMVRASNSEFIQTETIESVLWADFKKTLTVDNGKVISADGEVLDIEVVEGEYEFTLPKF